MLNHLLTLAALAALLSLLSSLPPALEILIGVFPLALKKSTWAECQSLPGNVGAGAGEMAGAGEGHDEKAGPSAGPSRDNLVMSPPTYSGEAVTTLVDESKYFQVKLHAQTVMMTVKGTIDLSNFKQNHMHRAKSLQSKLDYRWM